MELLRDIFDLRKQLKKDLNERNIQPFSDNYMKFIRYGQHFMDKYGDEILAYIYDNSFVDCLIGKFSSSKHFVTSETYNFPLYLYQDQNTLGAEVLTSPNATKVAPPTDKIMKEVDEVLVV